jgi:4'-phosphopantetheinyl transferase
MGDDAPAIWVVDLCSLAEADAGRCECVLGPAELEQMRRFRFDPDRESYRAAHALARMALSSVEPEIQPRDWVFEYDARGRPEIAHRADLPRLRFNLSHTRGMAACIVTHGIDCGVDVESVERCRGLNHLARTVLAPAELPALTGAPEAEQALLFSRFWTLKEAYSKGLGLGLSLPFERIVFELHEQGARLLNGSGDWSFEQWPPAPGYMVAVALRGVSPGPLVRHLGLPHPVSY